MFFESIGSSIMNGYYMPIMNWWASHPALFGFMEVVLGLMAAFVTVGLWWIQVKFLKFKKEKKNQTA